MMAATNQSSLNKLEIDLLEENLENCSVEHRFFVDYFDGKRDEFEDMLESFLLKEGLALKGLKSQEVFRKMVGSFLYF